MNDNLKALLDREPKDGLEYFRGAMQKLLAPYPGSYDLLGKVVAAFYVYEQSEALPPLPEGAELYLFLTSREAPSRESLRVWNTVEQVLLLLVTEDEAKDGGSYSNFIDALEDAWNQHT